jgi:anhydro-N-acetylmuramic acid kinase
MENTGNSHYVIPEKDLIMFKEAIVFAFLGALNYWGRVNVFDSATGSVKQHVGGAMYRGD